MDGISKLLDFCVWRIKYQYAVSASEEFAELINNINLDVINNALRIVNFIYGKLKTDGPLSTKHFGELRPKGRDCKSPALLLAFFVSIASCAFRPLVWGVA